MFYPPHSNISIYRMCNNFQVHFTSPFSLPFNITIVDNLSLVQTISTSSSTIVRFSDEKDIPISVMRLPESAYLPA